MDRLIGLEAHKERKGLSVMEECDTSTEGVCTLSASESNRFEAGRLFCCPSDWMTGTEITS